MVRCSLIWVSLLSAPLAAQRLIPVRSVSLAVGTDSGVVQFLDNIRPLASGRVLVNDAKRQRVILLEQTLQRFVTISDTAAGAPIYYPQGGAAILPYPGDSTVLLDPQSKAFVVIGPTGRVARTMALPNARDVALLSLGMRGPQGFDDRGRLVFSAVRTQGVVDAEQRAAPDPPRLVVIWTHDSSTIIRRDPNRATTDTLAVVAGSASKTWVLHQPNGRALARGAGIPIPTVDDWTLLADGTVAIVRGQDYHIDWTHPDGRVTSTPKMSYDWLRITPEQKQHLADSINAVFAARAATSSPPTPPPPGIPGRPDMTALPPASFEADSLPDFWPPVRERTLKSDPDGNVWVLPTTSLLANDGLVYDIVNRNGAIIERVKLPPGRRLLAVGYRGVVYMGYTPKGGLVRLERATIVR